MEEPVVAIIWIVSFVVVTVLVTGLSGKAGWSAPVALVAVGIEPGDEVIVETVEATYTYRLDTDPRELVVPFTGVWVLDEVPDNPEPGGVQPRQRPGQRLITLTTCAELFNTDDRMIAFGSLVKTEPKPGL